MPWPAPEIVHRVHDRYLREVVEGLGLCPFARRSRELGRVHRPLVFVDGTYPNPDEAGQSLLDIATCHPDAEIVLLTFIARGETLDAPDAFDRFVAVTRERYAALAGPIFFMVAFHPASAPDPGRPLTKDNLVPLIRQTPDPVIQCVRAEVLERARAQAQRAARERMIETLGGRDPRLRALIEHSVQADSELSAEIARNNFRAVGSGPGRERLEHILRDIRAERDEAYGDALRAG